MAFVSPLQALFDEERKAQETADTAAPLGSTLQSAEEQPDTPYTVPADSLRIIITGDANDFAEKPRGGAVAIEPDFYGAETSADGPVIGGADLSIPYVANALQSEGSPQEAAKARELYEQTGIDTTGVPEATKALEVRAKVDRGAEDLAAAPVASRWIASSQSNAAIAADITKQVADYEAIFKRAFAQSQKLTAQQRSRLVDSSDGLTNFVRDIADIPWAIAASAESIEANTLSSQEGLFELGLGMDALTPEQQARYKHIRSLPSPVPRGVIGKYAQLSAQQLPVFANLFYEGGKGLAAVVAAGLPAAALGGPGGAAFVKATGVVGFKAGMTIESFRQLMGEAREEFLSDKDLAGNPLDRDLVNKAAVVVGVLAAGAEAFGGYAVGKMLAKSLVQTLKARLSTRTSREILREAFKSTAITSLVEGTTEGVQDAIKIAGTHILRDIQGGEWAEITWGAIGERLLESFLAGSISTVPIGAGPQALATVRELQHANRANENRANIANAVTAYSESELKSRSPSAAKEFLNELNQSVEPVLIEPQVLATMLSENGVEPVQWFTSVGVSPETLEKALDTGQDVEVDAATLVDALSDSSVTELVQDNVRAEPGVPTTAEVALRKDAVMRRIEEVTAKFSKERTPESIELAESIAQQLVATGRQNESDAAASAAIWEAFYRVAKDAAESEGRDFSVEQYFEQLGLQIRTPAQLAQEEAEVAAQREAVEEQLDPLNQSQEWRDVEVSVPMETGDMAIMPAGRAFDSIRVRLDAANDLLRCVRGV